MNQFVISLLLLSCISCAFKKAEVLPVAAPSVIKSSTALEVLQGEPSLTPLVNINDAYGDLLAVASIDQQAKLYPFSTGRGLGDRLDWLKDGGAFYLKKSAVKILSSGYQERWKFVDSWMDTRRISDFDIRNNLKQQTLLQNDSLDPDFLIDTEKTSFDVKYNISADIFTKGQSVSDLRIELLTENESGFPIVLSSSMATDSKGAPWSSLSREGELLLKFRNMDKSLVVESLKNRRPFYLKIADYRVLDENKSSIGTKVDINSAIKKKSSVLYIVNGGSVQKKYIPQGESVLGFINKSGGSVDYSMGGVNIEEFMDEKSTLPFGKTAKEIISADYSLGRWVFLSDDKAIDEGVSQGGNYALVYVTGEEIAKLFYSKETFTLAGVTHDDATETKASIGRLNGGDIVEIQFTGEERQYVFSQYSYKAGGGNCRPSNGCSKIIGNELDILLGRAIGPNTQSGGGDGPAGGGSSGGSASGPHGGGVGCTEICDPVVTKYGISAELKSFPMTKKDHEDDYRVALVVGGKVYKLGSFEATYALLGEGGNLSSFSAVVVLDDLKRVIGGYDASVVVYGKSAGFTSIGPVDRPTGMVPNQVFQTFNIKINTARFGE